MKILALTIFILNLVCSFLSIYTIIYGSILWGFSILIINILFGIHIYYNLYKAL